MEYETATRASDFNEEDFKKFASRIGDRWTFDLPAEDLHNLESIMPDHVLTVCHIKISPGAEIMLGKLTRKK